MMHQLYLHSCFLYLLLVGAFNLEDGGVLCLGLIINVLEPFER